MKKLNKWGTFVALVPQSWVNLLTFQQVTVMMKANIYE